MKVLLVRPNNRSYVITPSLGLGYIAGALRQAGHTVQIADCLLERLSPRDFGRKVEEHVPDVIGFQLFSYDMNKAGAYLAAARAACPKATLVAGGPHPSGDPEGTLQILPDLDYLFKGEAEIGFPLLLQQMDGALPSPPKAPGMGSRDDEGSMILSPPAFVQDLDSLPLPAWDIIEPERYPEAPHGAFSRSFPTAPIITSRGCPCRCTFCAAQTISSGKVRKRSIDGVLEELALLHRRGIREFHIEDENFTDDKERVLLFCEQLERQALGMSWSLPSGVRIDRLDGEMLDVMERAGCYSMALGIEFGTDRIMRLTKKGLDTEATERQLMLFRGRGIKTTGFFLFGIPGETLDEMKTTMEFALKLPLDRAQFNNFMPLPGSALWSQLRSAGKLENLNWDRFFVHDVAYSEKGIDPAQIKALQRQAYLRFYLRPHVLSALMAEVKSWRHFRFLLNRFVDSII